MVFKLVFVKNLSVRLIEGQSNSRHSLGRNGFFRPQNKNEACLTSALHPITRRLQRFKFKFRVLITTLKSSNNQLEQDFPHAWFFFSSFFMETVRAYHPSNPDQLQWLYTKFRCRAISELAEHFFLVVLKFPTLVN